ncbi:PO113 protein, partial [Neodrepanis coruscans]|nr:PO113 protein [Neodrepanis coruscans]
LSEGNARADQLVAAVWPMTSGNKFQQAKQSHAFLHQSAKMLVKQFALYPSYQKNSIELGVGVNPRELLPLQIWQIDVTHVQEFGLKKYVHVSVDTYSYVIWATAQ